MQTISVVSVEGDAIIAVSASGERFRLPLDSALRARLSATAPAAEGKRLSPREIQAHVRSGLSTEQVAALTGAPVAYVERFTGPVLAERAYIVESALAVRLPPETEGARSRTFGAVMGERLDALAATGVSWSSAKEPAGWVLAAAFAADGVHHDARWRFDPKHMSLEPDNVEASTMSQAGTPAALTPRLRAIEPTAPVTVVPPAPVAVATERPSAPAARESAPAQRPSAPAARTSAPAARPSAPAARPSAPADRTRFDSDAFSLPELQRKPRTEAAPPAAPTPVQPARRAPMTTDQLTALVRPRDPRRDAVDVPTRPVQLPVRGDVFAARPEPVRPKRVEDDAATTMPLDPKALRRVPRDTGEVPRPADRQSTESPRGRQRPRRGRTSMPSWDEIVFGRDDE